MFCCTDHYILVNLRTSPRLRHVWNYVSSTQLKFDKIIHTWKIAYMHIRYVQRYIWNSRQFQWNMKVQNLTEPFKQSYNLLNFKHAILQSLQLQTWFGFKLSWKLKWYDQMTIFLLKKKNNEHGWTFLILS